MKKIDRQKTKKSRNAFKFIHPLISPSAVPHCVDWVSNAYAFIDIQLNVLCIHTRQEHRHTNTQTHKHTDQDIHRDQ